MLNVSTEGDSVSAEYNMVDTNSATDFYSTVEKVVEFYTTENIVTMPLHKGYYLSKLSIAYFDIFSEANLKLDLYLRFNSDVRAVQIERFELLKLDTSQANGGRYEKIEDLSNPGHYIEGGEDGNYEIVYDKISGTYVLVCNTLETDEASYRYMHSVNYLLNSIKIESTSSIIA